LVIYSTSSIHSAERYFIDNLVDHAIDTIIGVIDRNFESFSTIATLEIIHLVYANIPPGSKIRLYVARNVAWWSDQGKPHPAEAVISVDEELVEFRKQLLDGWLFDSDGGYHPNEAHLCDYHWHEGDN
jgi:hypothetical protein